MLFQVPTSCHHSSAYSHSGKQGAEWFRFSIYLFKRKNLKNLPLVIAQSEKDFFFFFFYQNRKGSSYLKTSWPFFPCFLLKLNQVNKLLHLKVKNSILANSPIPVSPKKQLGKDLEVQWRELGVCNIYIYIFFFLLNCGGCTNCPPKRLVPSFS